jgi:RHS repeat-associated protein
VNVYDAKGQTTDKDGRIFEWDDDGRMTAIVDGTHRSEMAYDGYGRRIKIAEFDNGVITSKKLYWWLGREIVTERDGLTTGFPILKQFFSQGVIANGVKLFYTWDQLGSVRELIDSTGAVRADYRYSPYGERTKEAGDLDSDWGYAGLWHHGSSGLDLATCRTYDSAQGRWISRDPLGEGVDYNLYRYCGNNPMGFSDPDGLQPLFPLFGEPITPKPGIGGRGGTFRNSGGNIFEDAGKAAQQEQSIRNAQKHSRQNQRDFKNGKFDELPPNHKPGLHESIQKSVDRLDNALEPIDSVQDASTEGLVCPISCKVAPNPYPIFLLPDIGEFYPVYLLRLYINAFQRFNWIEPSGGPPDV